ncbi:MAG: PIN domain-containing protein [Zhongshania sp.]|uniref:type II toxin-antitoxin system VapC family toxin n=1 Tax=Zhongshania sp. TaxID=1971902 RepID=UPI002636E3DC|nr:PIN domain-containing protein [Zhongshania sp.]MDF1693985.1 PIN domain-containing protein [Zhongshania sp.]
MRVALDTNVLIVLLNRGHNSLRNPADNSIVDRVYDRAQRLIDDIDRQKGVILIPSPVLAELFVKYSKPEREVIERVLAEADIFEIVNFDTLAAMECANLVNDKELRELEKLERINPHAIKTKIQVDRQILAICQARNCNHIISHDKGLLSKAREIGMSAKSLADFDPVPEQVKMELLVKDV